MFDVALKWPSNAQFRNQWSYVLTNFGVTRVYEIGAPKGTAPIVEGAVAVRSVADLPDVPIVLAHPQYGRWFNAACNIRDFRHPESAIYLFWADNLQLHPDDLDNREVTSIYVPAASLHDFHSFVVAAIICYDWIGEHG